jgi:N-acyl-D-amino-acid deacylase
LALIDRLATRQSVGMDVYPYTAGSTVLREDLVDGVIDILITGSEPYPEMAGKLLADVAEAWGIDQRDACRRLMPGGACYFQMDEEDVRRVLSHPRTMIGSDGLPHDARPHPRLWGAFPRVLGRYARELGLLPLESAVFKMTGLAAAQFSLGKRGTLAVGHPADVTVFDPRRIRDRATFADPEQVSEGVCHVFVNGASSYEEDAAAPSDPPRNGRFLRRDPSAWGAAPNPAGGNDPPRPPAT